MKVAIWLDDFRDPSAYRQSGLINNLAPEIEDVLWAKSYQEFVDMFPQAAQKHEIQAVFFDNDLGGGPGEDGRHAFNWMEAYVREHNLKPFRLHAQTANPSAKRELHLGFSALYRYWQK